MRVKKGARYLLNNISANSAVLDAAGKEDASLSQFFLWPVPPLHCVIQASGSMSFFEAIFSLPLPGLFFVTLLIDLLSTEGGFRLGKRVKQEVRSVQAASVASMLAAIFGLFAFILAFTFQMAASRFETRFSLVLEEANAIGTTYLRADLLAEPFRTEIRSKLKEYLDTRLKGIQTGEIESAVVKSEELQTRLWSQAVSAASHYETSIPTGLFIASLNNVIDAHAKRLQAGRNRLPAVIWVVLYFFAVFSMAAVGYHAGLTGTHSPPVLVVLVLTFTVVMFLIADLDRSQAGLLRVSQRALIDVRNGMAP